MSDIVSLKESQSFDVKHVKWKQNKLKQANKKQEQKPNQKEGF